MLIKRYAKNGTQIVKKSDIKSLPFEEISEYFSDYKSSRVSELLEERNKLLLLTHKRMVNSLKVEDSESSREQEDDSIRDFVPCSELDDDNMASIVSTGTDLAVVEFVTRYDIVSAWSWLGPQLMALLASYRLPEKVEGKYRGHDFLSLNIDPSNPRDMGIYRFVAKVARGKVMSKHTDPDHLPYCALVPLFLAAQKKFHNVPFSDWSVDGLQYVVDKDMYAAMTCDPMPPGITTEELIAIRDLGLQYTSKAKGSMGQVKSYSPITYHQLTGITDTAIGKLPKYAKAMVTQIWCANPANRHKYMVLDPWSWDNIPQPLISHSVYYPQHTTTPSQLGKNPWS